MPLDHLPPSELRLAPDEIDPVLELNTDSASPFLFTSDHYGRIIPRMLGDLGLPASELTRHIAWDIGIAGVAERVAMAMNAHLIAQRYSRLVIDCNRPPDAVSSIPLISEATTIPGNDGLTQDDRARRRELFFDPYHRRIDAVIDARLKVGQPTVLVSLHSFTPVYAGIKRPWHIGTLYQHDRTLPPQLLQHLRAEGDLVVGDNEPYAVSDATDYTIPVHGEKRGLMNTGIEIRQDLITDESGQIAWAERLVRILTEIAATLVTPRASHL
ncbi:N-formylglutamate amidohydrolase [Tardiphaga sp.]|jgi:predicted N-formylglutamate amidohydrolase|uniref:N-formylglutamate amidohydrolase n=1 Tax=Tardiphaga sp. TaxID=1926292 RepID=UPI0037D9EFF1